MKSLQIHLLLFLLLLSGSVNAQRKSVPKNQESGIVLQAQKLARISSLNQQVKTIDSATLRTFLRLKLSDFIWKKKFIDGQSLAENIIQESVEDFQKNITEIPDFYKSSLQADILSILRINSPTLYKKISDNFDSTSNSLQSYRLAGDYGNSGILNAVEDVKNRLLPSTNPADRTAIIFIVKKLLLQNKVAEVNSILEAIIERQEQSILDDSKLLFFLSRDFIAQTTPISLQKRFLIKALNNGQILLQKLNSGNVDRETHLNVYNTLRNNLQEIEKLLPSEYPRALVIASALQNKSSQSDKIRQEIAERIEQSKDKLQQTISEAKQVDDKKIKNDLWQDAAQLALKEKKYQLSIDCLNEIESADPGFALWRDQFLDDDITKSALDNNDIESAKYAISKIESKLRSGTALLQIVTYYYKNKDALQSQAVLAEAVKRIKETDDNPQKVRVLSEALNTALTVNDAVVYEIAQIVVKTVNSIPSPNLENALGSDAQKKFVDEVQMVIIANILPAFQGLAKQDSSIAQNLANDLPRDYRMAALCGIETGAFFENVITKPVTIQKTSKN
ncbi:MAG TPA: hypothetical protein VF648_18635 [Pyrinomonadaceae bacterium]|jgi:hypothetical protein